MSHLYQQYRALELDGSWIGLEAGNATPWFCTPIGAEIIGWDGAIHYCFVPGFAETVFCVNLENYGGHLVYPIARSFADFLSLLLAVGHTNSLQQVIGWKQVFCTDRRKWITSAARRCSRCSKPSRKKLEWSRSRTRLAISNACRKNFRMRRLHFPTTTTIL